MRNNSGLIRFLPLVPRDSASQFAQKPRVFVCQCNHRGVTRFSSRWKVGNSPDAAQPSTSAPAIAVEPWRTQILLMIRSSCRTSESVLAAVRNHLVPTISLRSSDTPGRGQQRPFAKSVSRSRRVELLATDCSCACLVARVERGVHAAAVPEGRPTIAHRFNGGDRGQRESSPVGTKETVHRCRGDCENLCRPYGTQYAFKHVHPAINRWAIFGCPSGTQRNRVAHVARAFVIREVIDIDELFPMPQHVARPHSWPRLR